MSQHTLGLQWKLAGIYLASSVVGAGTVAAGYYIGGKMGLAPAPSLGAGLAAGLVVSLVGALTGLLMARKLKLRLWEAGDMAGRIARGDFGVRLYVGADDEVGWLEEQLNQMAIHLETAVGELRNLAEQNRALAEEAGRGAALEERAKLARDLHDTVNQQLFVLAMRAAAARKRLEKAGSTPDLVPELAMLEELSRQAHGEARQLILQLRPTTLEQQGLGPALAEYVKSAAAKEGWEVIDEIDRSVRLGGGLGENLFRAAQEALNNVSKHARASKVRVTLEKADDSVLLQVRDDGQGFDTKAGVRPTAVGLCGMQERVEALHGSMRVKSAVGQGTEVTVEVPLTEGGDRS
ncbi:MAG: two-component sensor histidine kinase [Symbiobacteriaceae bacterium]|jgi:NarL family two-component system sensor histidine kinase LiaS|nr:two-component sensor histidine kinase [Symbiobacteriaceae bacterium]